MAKISEAVWSGHLLEDHEVGILNTKSLGEWFGNSGWKFETKATTDGIVPIAASKWVIWGWPYRRSQLMKSGGTGNGWALMIVWTMTKIRTLVRMLCHTNLPDEGKSCVFTLGDDEGSGPMEIRDMWVCSDRFARPACSHEEHNDFLRFLGWAASSEGLYRVRRYNNSLSRFFGVVYRRRQRRREQRRQRGSSRATDHQKSVDGTPSQEMGRTWRERCRISPITAKRRVICSISAWPAHLRPADLANYSEQIKNRCGASQGFKRNKGKK